MPVAKNFTPGRSLKVMTGPSTVHDFGELGHDLDRIGQQRAVRLLVELDLHQAFVDVDADLLVLLAADVGGIEAGDVGRDGVDQRLCQRGPAEACRGNQRGGGQFTTRRAKKRRSIDMSESSGCSGGQTWLEIAGWEGRLSSMTTGQATAWSSPISISGGLAAEQAGCASGQRPTSRQASGGSIGARDLARQTRARALRRPSARPARPRAARACRDAADRRTGPRVGPSLDDAAEIHHRDAVGDVLHDLQVVADEEIGEVQPLLQVEQQVEDLAADRDVERGGRLVEDDDVGRDRDRAGDADALALAAAQLVRIAVEMGRGRGPTISISSRTRAVRARCAAGRDAGCSGSSSTWRTLMRGLSEALGSWNTIWMRR